MAPYLRVNPGLDPATGALTGANYRLPVDRDDSDLAQKISGALMASGCLSIEVEMFRAAVGAKIEDDDSVA